MPLICISAFTAERLKRHATFDRIDTTLSTKNMDGTVSVPIDWQVAGALAAYSRPGENIDEYLNRLMTDHDRKNAEAKKCE